MAEAPRAGTPRVDVVRALREAALTGLIAFGLFLPLIGLQDRPEHPQRARARDALAVACSRWSRIIAAAPLSLRAGDRALARAPRHRGPPPAARRLPRVPAPSPNGFTPFALGFVVVYPMLVLSLTGFQGAIKWIDNFGIQILIYVMLGWGLNIVVGLAGLLDLGYVAFYAVGAYSYALLAHRPSACRSGSCCRSPASWPRSGACCSAFRCCGCAAIISRSSRSPSARSSASS